MMKKILRIAVLSSALLFSSTFALAEDTTSQTSTSTTAAPTDTTTGTTTTETSTTGTTTNTTRTTTGTTTTTSTPTPKDTEVAANLSKAYTTTVTAQDVANARATGLGYGEIGNLYGLAAISGTPVSDIAAMRQTLGWGEIAQSLGVKLSDIKNVDKPAKAKDTVEKTSATEKTTDKASAKQANAKSNTTSSGSNGKGSSGSGGNSGGGHGGSGGSGGGGGHGGGHK